MSLTAADLAPIVDEARRRWSESGLIADPELRQLEGMDVVIADLPALTLALATTDTIYVDVNAAGFGWFVDATPFDDTEFLQRADGSLWAQDGSDAAVRMDLFTAVMHEMGHVLGLDHAEAEADVMNETLAAGERLPLSDEIDGQSAMGILPVPEPATGSIQIGPIFLLTDPSWFVADGHGKFTDFDFIDFGRTGSNGIRDLPRVSMQPANALFQATPRLSLFDWMRDYLNANIWH